MTKPKNLASDLIWETANRLGRPDFRAWYAGMFEEKPGAKVSTRRSFAPVQSKVLAAMQVGRVTVSSLAQVVYGRDDARARQTIRVHLCHMAKAGRIKRLGIGMYILNPPSPT